MLALGAVVMLCAVAIIGAGYAAFSNTASARTYNENNSADVEYLTLAPGGDSVAARWAAISTISNKVAFSTYQYVTMVDDDSDPSTPDVPDEEKVAYYFADAGSAGTGPAATYTVKAIANKDFILTNSTSSTLTKIQFKTQASAEAAAWTALSGSDFKYFVKVTVGANAPVYILLNDTLMNTGDQTVSVASGDPLTINVAICIGYVPNVTIPASYHGEATHTESDNAIDSDAAPIDLPNVSFAFEVTDTSA